MADFRARPFSLHEANLRQLQQLKPNVAVLPWGATEAHQYHLPHGTDVIEAAAVAEAAVDLANQQGARCILLPTIPFGNDNLQLTQIATITMRSSTQHAVLFDVADSLSRQEIDRLVIVNFHGGNDFRQIIRDLMMDHPIFIVQVNAHELSPESSEILANRVGDHANEFETSLMLYLEPKWVAPLEQADDGTFAEFQIEALKATGVWCPRNWAALTSSTGVGNPKLATREKGEMIFNGIVAVLKRILRDLSNAKEGDFPYVLGKQGYGSARHGNHPVDRR